MSEHKLTPEDAGCWLEGSQGWHNTYRVVDVARSLGMPLPEGWQSWDEIDTEISRYENLYASDSDQALDSAEAVAGQGGLADQATDYLNSIAPDGYEFVWDAGELCLQEADES